MDEWTVLHLACHIGHLTVVQYLVQNGNDDATSVMLYEAILGNEDGSMSFISTTSMDPPPTIRALSNEELSMEDYSSGAKKKRKRKGADQKEKIFVPNYIDGDVMCSLGEFTNRHPGNGIFRNEKARFQRRYLQAATRKMKKGVAQELVDFMGREHGSRFLAYDKATKQWYIVINERALEKSKQLLREDFTPEERKLKRLLYAVKHL